MNEAARGAFRPPTPVPPCPAPPAGGAAPPPPAASGPVADAQALRERVLPEATAPRAGEAGPPGRYPDPGRIGKNALTSAVSLGATFGVGSAIGGWLRTRPQAPPAMRVAGGLLPTLAIGFSPWIEHGMRCALGTTATYPAQPSLAQDAVAPAVLFAFNAACARSPRIPKFPPGTPAGMAATVGTTAVSSLLAGAASELAGQASRHDTAPADDVTEPYEPWRKAQGRMFSQVPAAGLATALALSGRALPASLSLLPLGLVTGGWTFRRELMPPRPSAEGEPAPAPPDPSPPPPPAPTPAPLPHHALTDFHRRPWGPAPEDAGA